jgi:hypothetical protein
VLLLVGAAAFGPHVDGGGFYYDDWATYSTYHLGPDAGLISSAGAFLRVDAQRPLLALWLAASEGVFGADMRLRLAWTALLAVAVASSLYLALRTLGLPRLHAFVIAVLALLFPYSDARWLWSTLSGPAFSLCCYLLGVAVAVGGLRSAGARAVARHAGAIALFALSILTYEITAAAIALTGVLYLGRAPVRAVATRWSVDVVMVALTALLVTSRAVPIIPGGNPHTSLSLHDQVVHARLIGSQGAVLLARTAWPFADVPKLLVLGVVAALAGAAVVVIRSRRRAADADVRRWLAAAVLGLIMAGAGWLTFVPADWYYAPLQVGIGNRVNMLAGLGLVTVVYASAMLATSLAAHALHVSPGRTAWIAVTFAVALGVSYAQRVAADVRTWDAAYRRESAALRVMSRLLPGPMPGTTILLFGSPGFRAPGVPIFAASWDLNGAVHRVANDPTLSAYPVLEGSVVRCGLAGVTVTGGVLPAEATPAPYHHVVALDLPSRTVERLMDPRACRQWVARVAPGPLLDPSA